MPIRINLKELFDSDSQEITIDKINFNFNKLLELGIGLPGPTGLTGSIGSAGPLGPQGIQGDDGNKWFVGSGNPNSQTFIDLNDNDFYIDVDNSSIYQYDAAGNQWDLLIDLETVVNNYLASSGATFVRGLGDASPLDNRFILFPQRGNTANDSLTDIIGSSASNNDIFYLNNFNESVYNIVDWPNEEVLYDAIQKIHVDFTSSVPGRYHLELGTLYTESATSNMRLTDLKHNLKFRHFISDTTAAPAQFIPNQTEPIPVGQLSLAPIESQGPGDLDFNSVFEFRNSKFNTNGVQSQSSTMFTRIGPREALGEFDNGDLHMDGIRFQFDDADTVARFGVALALGNDIIGGTPFDIQSRFTTTGMGLGTGRNVYVMISGDNNAGGLMLDAGDVVQREGNIDMAGMGVNVGDGGRCTGDPNPESDTQFGQTPIIAVDNQIFAVTSFFQEADFNGQLVIPQRGCTVSRYGIGGDKDRPFDSNQYSIGSTMAEVLPYGTTYDTINTDDPFFNNNNGKRFHGTALADMKSDGKYIYSVHNHMRGSSKLQVCDPNSWTRTYFQVSKIQNNSLQGIGHLNDYVTAPSAQSPDQTVGSENCFFSGAWRLELDGNTAWVCTNNLKDWGHNTYDYNPYQAPYRDFPNDAINNYGLHGYVGGVDISDPENPIKMPLTALQEQVIGFQEQTHYLDMCQDTRHLYTLGLTLGTKSGGGGLPNPGYAGDGSCCVTSTYEGQTQFSSGCAETPDGDAGTAIEFDGYRVRIQAFSKLCSKGGTPDDTDYEAITTLQAQSADLFNNIGDGDIINSSNYKQMRILNHFGTLDTDGTYVYAAFDNMLKIVEVLTANLGPTEANNTPDGNLADVSLINFTDFTNIQAVDCRALGNSLYILHTSSIMPNQDQYQGANIGKGMQITKVDVKDRSNPEVVWTRDLVDRNGEVYSYASRFVVVGNNIYLHQGNQNELNNAEGGLIVVEVDGLETDHINAGAISSRDLSTTNASVNGGLEVHGSANIGNSLNVGCALSVSGGLTVDGGMTVAGMPVGAGSPVGMIIAYAGTAEPNGWLKLDGQVVQVNDYPALAAMCPSNWVGTITSGKGSYQGITLPDLQGKYMRGVVGTVGHIGGVDSYSLGVSNLPQHSHEVRGSTNTDGMHTHDIATAASNQFNQNYVSRAENQQTNDNDEGLVKDEGSAHSHEIDMDTLQTGGNPVTPIPIAPPHMEITWLIKAVPGA